MASIEWEKVDKGWIDQLVSAQEPEGTHLEYKELLAVGNDAEKREFLADVTSFANGAGGDIMFGISEARDANGKPTNLPAAALGLAGVADADRTKLENILTTGCAPRLPVQMKLVPGFPNGPVLVIRVPRSWSAPHMVTFQGLSRFFSRNSAGKVQLDVHQIRSAFAQTDALSERILRFRAERIARIIAGDGPKPTEGQTVVLHLVPYAAFSPGSFIEVRAFADDARLRPLGGRLWNRRYNLDGLLDSSPVISDYAQLFRNGAVEAMVSLGTLGDFSALGIEQQYLRPGIPKLYELVRSVGGPNPVAILLTILNVGGLRLEMPPNHFARPFSDYTVDRNELLLPDVVLEADLEPNRLDASMKPLYDAMWQSAGFPGSPSYDESGLLKVRR